MNRLRCGPLAAWATAWLAGTVAFDDVLSAASVGAHAPALALAAPPIGTERGAGPVGDGRPAPLGEILIAWRQARAHVRLALPVPGDVRGIPGPVAFRTAAIDAGQAVVGSTGSAGIEPLVGVVPVVVDHRPSSALPTLQWCRFEIEPPAPDEVSIADAQYELSEAIRDCASTLAQLARTDRPNGHRPDGPGAGLNDELSAARRAGERINLPPGFPPKAVSLVAQAERMAAVLSLAGVDTPALDATYDKQRAQALAPLVVAVRRARLAGYNAAA